MVVLCIVGLTSCTAYKNGASALVSVDEVKIGMSRESVMDKFGQPFSFDLRLSDNDTITVLSYKTPRPVADCEFIVTTELSFVNNRLRSVSQSSFYVPENVIVCDSTKIGEYRHEN